MKKFIVPLLFVFMLVASVAYAATWHTANQATVGWDAVTTDIDGDPIASGMTMEYEVFHVAHNSSDFDADKVSDGTTALTNHTVTLAKGHWYVGVQGIMIDTLDSTEVARGAIAWSNVPADCLNGEDFGLRYYVNPNKATNLDHVGP